MWKYLPQESSIWGTVSGHRFYKLTRDFRVASCSHPGTVVVAWLVPACPRCSIRVYHLPSLDCSARICKACHHHSQPVSSESGPYCHFSCQDADWQGGGRSLGTRHVSGVTFRDPWSLYPSLVQAVVFACSSCRLLPFLVVISSEISEWHPNSHPLNPSPLRIGKLKFRKTIHLLNLQRSQEQ